MPEGQVLEFSGVTKRFGAVTAVSDFSARVEPGIVTGFLGPNGAGKTTTLRILLGLVKATSGSATIGGVPYAKLPRPLETVGAVLEASSFHPGRTAANHLKVYAQAARIPAARVDDALATVGLSEVAGRKVGGFSLGMRQRLGLAYALLGDPGVLVLDEPANGLDPEGIRWMRGLLRQLARQGRTVLVSSHMLTEVQQTVDALLIISQGRLVFQGGLNDLADPTEFVTVVDSPDRAALTAALSEGGVSYEVLRSGLTVRGVDPAQVGTLAAAAGVALSTLQRRGPALEEVFLDLVNGVRLQEPDAGDERTALPPVDSGAVDGADAAADSAETQESESGGADAEAAAIAATLDEETDGAPGAAAAVGAAGVAAAMAAGADDDEEEPVDADAADDAPHAAFAVASTGVVEVIPEQGAAEAAAEADAGPGEEAVPAAAVAGAAEDPEHVSDDAAQARPEPAGDAEWSDDGDLQPHPADDAPQADAPQEEIQQEDAAESEPNPWAEPASEPEPEASAGDEPSGDESTPAEADAEVPETEPEKTESDIEADRFFSAFDDGTDSEPEQGERDAEAEHGESEPAEAEHVEPEQTESESPEPEHPEPEHPEPEQTEPEAADAAAASVPDDEWPAPEENGETGQDAADGTRAADAEAPLDEPQRDEAPSEFGSWSDLAPEWDPNADSSTEGGEQR